MQLTSEVPVSQSVLEPMKTRGCEGSDNPRQDHRIVRQESTRPLTSRYRYWTLTVCLDYRFTVSNCHKHQSRNEWVWTDGEWSRTVTLPQMTNVCLGGGAKKSGPIQHGMGSHRVRLQVISGTDSAQRIWNILFP